MSDQITQTMPDPELLKKHFEKHHAPELMRDPDTGELVPGPELFAANRQTRPVPPERITTREE